MQNSMSMNKIIKTISAQVLMQMSGNDVAMPYLQGSPGIGKTEICIDEFVRKKKMNMLHIHFGLVPIEEISGLPVFEGVTLNGKEVQGTVWSLPEIMTKVYKLANEKPTVIFIDDVHLCSPAHMALMFEMFTEKSIRGVKFPEKTAFVLAGNSSAKAGAKTMFSAIVNRCAVYPVEADFGYWKSEFALRNNVNKKVVAFLSNERYQSKYMAGEELVNSPWPSLRAWTRFGNLLNAMEAAKLEIPPSDVAYYASAHVGSEAGGDFSGFYNFYSKTQMDEVFDKTKKIVIPDDNSGKYIYGISAVNEYSSRIIRDDKKKWPDYVDTFGDIIINISKFNSEIGFAMMKELLLIESSLKKDMIYGEIKKNMRKKDPVIESKFTTDVINSSSARDI